MSAARLSARMMKRNARVARQVSFRSTPPITAASMMSAPAGLKAKPFLSRPTGVGLRKVPRMMPAGAALKARNVMHGRGKLVAGSIAGASVVNGMRNRSGRAADPVRGRPTGPYQF